MVSGFRWCLIQMLLGREKVSTQPNKSISPSNSSANPHSYSPVRSDDDSFSKTSPEKVFHSPNSNSSNNTTTTHPLQTIYQLSPIMTIFFFLSSYALEMSGEKGWLRSSYFKDVRTSAITLSAISGCGIIALLSRFIFIFFTIYYM
jgi:hypothetical protein